MKPLVLAMLLLATPSLAQTLPGSAAADARIRTIEYAPGGLTRIETSPDIIQTVLFAPGETVTSVIVSDPNAYVISAAGSGDSLSIKATGKSSLAIMSVRTDRRSYELELTAGGTGQAPALVRFAYGAAQQTSAAADPALPIRKAEGVSWKLSGSKELRPAEVSDDGQRTYIVWSDDQAMPAVFAIGPGNAELMVDGYMRGQFFTIDRVHERLVFRIDKQVARAKRIRKRARNEQRSSSSASTAG